MPIPPPASTFRSNLGPAIAYAPVLLKVAELPVHLSCEIAVNLPWEVNNIEPFTAPVSTGVPSMETSVYSASIAPEPGFTTVALKGEALMLAALATT